MQPVLIKIDGSEVALATFEANWSASGEWRFTATAKAHVPGKISALGLFGRVHPVKIDNVHASEERTVFAGRFVTKEGDPVPISSG